jgi:hypothetical protein
VRRCIAGQASWQFGSWSNIAAGPAIGAPDEIAERQIVRMLGRLAEFQHRRKAGVRAFEPGAALAASALLHGVPDAAFQCGPQVKARSGNSEYRFAAWLPVVVGL